MVVVGVTTSAAELVGEGAGDVGSPRGVVKVVIVAVACNVTVAGDGAGDAHPASTTAEPHNAARVLNLLICPPF